MKKDWLLINGYKFCHGIPTNHNFKKRSRHKTCIIRTRVIWQQSAYCTIVAWSTVNEKCNQIIIRDSNPRCTTLETRILTIALLDRGSNPRCTTLEARILTITLLDRDSNPRCTTLEARILTITLLDRGSNPRSTTLEARILTITLLRQGLEPTMYNTRGENLNHYTTETGTGTHDVPHSRRES